MAATKVLVFYDALGLISLPSKCLRRIVKIDNDGQSTNHVALTGEVKVEVPIATYNTFGNELDAVNYILTL